MCKKLILLVSVVLVLDMLFISEAGAADPDLVGWWRLDDGSGDTAIDLSNSGNEYGKRFYLGILGQAARRWNRRKSGDIGESIRRRRQRSA